MSCLQNRGKIPACCTLTHGKKTPALARRSLTMR